MFSAIKTNYHRKSLVQSEIDKELIHLESETKYQRVFNHIRAIIVRIFFLAIICFYIYYLISLSKSFFYMFMIIGPILIIIDGIYVIIFRKGKEPSW
jgi:hypothetical protein